MIMPYYAIGVGLSREAVGMSYSKEIVTDLLRAQLGFRGVVNSDTAITSGMPWGVETLSVKERYKKAIDAGVDRLGGDSTSEIIVDLVKSGELSRGPVDESARRILRVLFALGLFENPYVNPEEAARTVRRADFQEKADLAQRKSIVLLKNSGNVLPLKAGARIYVEGVDPAVAARYGYVSTGRPGERGRLRGSRGHEGEAGCLRAAAGARCRSISRCRATLLEHVRAVMKKKPTIVALHLDNPLVVPELAKDSAALVATFGVSDEALFDVLTGRFAPTGKLPFEMPSSMEAVLGQLEDVPHDSKAPLVRVRSGTDVSADALRRRRS